MAPGVVADGSVAFGEMIDLLSHKLSCCGPTRNENDWRTCSRFLIIKFQIRQMAKMTFLLDVFISFFPQVIISLDR